MITASNINDYNPLEIPMYYPAEISRLIKISIPRVHRWLKGYEYIYRSNIRRQEPLFRKHKIYYATFLDLIDLLLVKRLLDYGLSLQKIRKALDEAREILGIDHFANETFFTDGVNICLMIKDKKGNDAAIIELLSKGQFVLKQIIQELAHQIDFDEITKLARRWFPLEGNHLVVLDPHVSFGRPVIYKKGIPTEVIYELYIAEKKNTDVVCAWMSLSPDEVNAAIKFEEYLLSN